MRRPTKRQIQPLTDKQLSDLAEVIACERLHRSLSRWKEERGAPMAHAGKRARAEALLAACKTQLPELEALLENVNGHWVYVDRMYRFYHHSLKVFWLQEQTLQIRDALQALMPELKLNSLFRQVLAVGTGSAFDMQRSNRAWLPEALPITAAFLHAKFFLEMAIRCAKTYDRVDQVLGSDLAALLYLFNLR